MEFRGRGLLPSDPKRKKERERNKISSSCWKEPTKMQVGWCQVLMIYPHIAVNIAKIVQCTEVNHAAKIKRRVPVCNSPIVHSSSVRLVLKSLVIVLYLHAGLASIETLARAPREFVEEMALNNTLSARFDTNTQYVTWRQPSQVQPKLYCVHTLCYCTVLQCTAMHHQPENVPG